jgi:hypothetical protein
MVGVGWMDGVGGERWMRWTGVDGGGRGGRGGREWTVWTGWTGVDEVDRVDGGDWVDEEIFVWIFIIILGIWELLIEKNRFFSGFSRAGGGRTHTVSPPGDFKSPASANSATAPRCRTYGVSHLLNPYICRYSIYKSPMVLQ